ncbi:transaminase, acetylornithine/succinylornithine family protein [Ehrlichia chaffeensis str. Heartland]|uniref:Acetylornithine/succinyldiaminopimelate aminotransferase n=1 Tax=Ehrlichia chaffeensis (strain ATCC CRL-10679 / Arkansas) TaxID=205920 RepID=Q2GFV2_EHRCR|nr:aspartate aminotransferase family protein [Ehrlichia chaffeensis]ABD45332.1 acetylornithine/succinyldiaminopimelate aminotransferase [Ehrlichia chaffeensis str. Arkansas]AHX03929.1 transaminase, acetylornithine/succinylornithine family protein [Ehrlichia chaffeensis str. Heartland]AHX05341.1 transaminase, acetylornithine/succinylornithine family protein [Ehrlichia chaffeensis str. Jax]AHX06329.1 transaminase, acetylornithine/succinylornithine family protein [Ehrlichia chaffeensis str. Libert
MNSSPILPVYAPSKVTFSHGKGVYLYDYNNKKYVDFHAGIATSSLGHAHPALVNALKTQGEKLWHISNVHTIPEAIKLAQKLVDISFADKVFFNNSGAESVECCLKIARSYQCGKGNTQRYRFITMKQSYHGRTCAACSANDPSKFSPFLKPYVEWFDCVNPDITSIKNAINETIGAILLEPIQGEGGINVLDDSFLKELRTICDQNDILLIFDCVQCGSGRTGKFFAHEHTGVTPDICCLAKGLGGGFPISATLATNNASQFMGVGMHGSTFGGNPLATTIGMTVVEEILKDGFLDNVTKNGHYLYKRLEDLAKKFPVIEEVKGKGLMIGLKINTNINNRELMHDLISCGLLTNTASNNTLRIVPPLIITQQEIDEGLAILESYLQSKYHQ